MYDIIYKPSIAIKAHDLSDFLSEWMKTQTPPRKESCNIGLPTLTGPYNIKVQEQEYW
jgi:hypothetical protein